jgi:hypothetical protein
MTTAAILAVTAEAAFRTVAIELLFDSAPVRLTGSPLNVRIEDADFLGIGAMGKISVAEEAGDLQSYSMTFVLSGIPRDAVALAFTEPFQGRPATVWDVPMTSDFVPVLDPVIIFRGRMDQMQIDLGETAGVTVTILNRLADWERPRVLRYSDVEQQRAFVGDLGMQFAAAMENKEISWPAAGWFRKHPNG